jgi:S-formylglutathione hydrolase FrmB
MGDMKTILHVLCGVAVWMSDAGSLAAADWSFEVGFDGSVRAEPYSGRVYLFFSAGNREPRMGPSWFFPEPFASKDVTNLAPGETVSLSAGDDDLLFYPEKPEEFDPAGYQIQAVMRFNSWDREVGRGAGNGYSPADRVPEEGRLAEGFVLSVNRLVPPPEFVETESVKLCAVESQLLSEFHGRKVTLKAAVLLPPEYRAEPDRRFPALFIIPGFGGTHHDHRIYARLYSSPDAEESTPLIRVLLDPACREGHHVFADSAVNGPWGTALVKEFLPDFEARFRTVADREGRFLTGHSSGGWSSLWVMITHPDTFAATWSTAPDPVTFRDFQQIDLYAANENMYRNRSGQLRPLSRIHNDVQLWYREFDHMETVLGHGGQLRSFEAVFGPRQADGGPRSAWDRKSGAIDPIVVEHWKQYDIVHKLESEWDALGPKLSGRLHVHMGEEDTFYLEGATRILQASMNELGEPDAVTMHPGRDHFDLLTPDLKRRMHGELRSHYRKYFAPDGQPLPGQK